MTMAPLSHAVLPVLSPFAKMVQLGESLHDPKETVCVLQRESCSAAVLDDFLQFRILLLGESMCQLFHVHAVFCIDEPAVHRHFSFCLLYGRQWRGLSRQRIHTGGDNLFKQLQAFLPRWISDPSRCDLRVTKLLGANYSNG